MIVLVGGGARSGKSAFALRRARDLGERRVFIATARALDGEMHARIDAHRAERGDAFTTIEEPVDLAAAIDNSSARAFDVAVVDCLTLWVSNLLVAGDNHARVCARLDDLVRALRTCPPHVVLVTNEVGMGIVPDNALARRFRDLAGHAHQRVAAVADELYLAAMGVVVRLRPSPVEVAS